MYKRQDALCTPVPVNDDCANATQLPVSPPGPPCPSLAGESNECATAAFDNPSCDPFGVIKDVWYTFYTGPNSDFELDVTPGTAGLLNIAIYEGCGTTLSQFCTIEIDSATTTIELTGLNDSSDYYLQVWTNNTDAGTFDLCLRLPAPVICNQPANLVVAPGTVSATFTWDAEPNALVSQLQYRIPPFAGGGSQGTNIIGAGITSKVINGLIPGSFYQSRLRHKCDDNPDVFSPWRFRPFNTMMIRGQQLDLDVSLYPNPANDFVNVAISSQVEATTAGEIEIVNILGQRVYGWTGEVSGKFIHPVDFSNQPAGHYLVKVYVEGKVIVEKLTVTK